MSSPPKRPRSKKGFRNYVKGRLSRSSQSPSPATQTAGAGSQSTLSTPVEGVGSTSVISLAPSDAAPSNSEVLDVGPTIPSAESTSIPIGSNPDTGTTSAEIPVAQASASSEKKTRGEVWTALGTSLRQVIKENLVSFPPIASATEAVLSCLDGLESIARNRKAFDDLSKELDALSQSLTQQIHASTSIRMTNAILNVVANINKQAEEVKEKLDRGTAKGIREANIDEEELLQHYQRIQQLFQQLQINASLSTWSIANEHLANTRLEGLQPSKQAAYDSSLSAEINRRGCAEGTRVGVLSELEEWLHNSTSPPVYWMNGMPGTGKTTIACTFTERLEVHKLLAASFFCTRSSANCKNVARIVPTIAYQLARYSIPFQCALCEVLSQDPDLGTKNMIKQFEKLLKEPLAKVKDAMPDKLVVVIDALDECEDRHGVERMLDLLFLHANDVPLKFLVTSRPEPEICSKMNLHAQSVVIIHLHNIEKSLTRVDIELYLKEELTSVSPTPDQIKQLVRRSGSLFIYAATLTRYVRFGGKPADTHQRLLSVLSISSGYESERSSNTTESSNTSEFMSAIGSISTIESTTDEDYTRIDALYNALLESAMEETQLEGKGEDLKLVLRTVLLAQEPIPAGAIAALTGMDDLDQVTFILRSLRFVFHKSGDNEVVSVLHASFPDFMFNKERSGQFHCNVAEQSILMAERCFEVMGGQLRFNICDLESSFVPDEKVENLERRIEKNIQPILAYACRYWAKHLESTPVSELLLAALDNFLSNQLLFWMEVLNLRREIGRGVESLIKARSWLNGWPELPEVALLAEDACNFVTGFAGQPIATPHIYVSWLPFYHRSSLVHKHYWKRTRGLIELNGTLLDKRDSSTIATWELGSEIQSAAYLPDGGRIAVKCDGNISIRNAFDGTILVGPLGDNNCYGSFAHSPDGALIACGTASPNCAIRLWDTNNGSLVMHSFEGHTGYVTCISFSPDSTRIVSGSRDCTVRVWDVTTGQLLLGPLTEHYRGVRSVSFSPSGTYFASGSEDQSICLRNAHDGSLVTRRPLFSFGTVPITLSFSPDSTQLVAGYPNRTISVWSTSDGTFLADIDGFNGQEGYVSSVVFSPDGVRVASITEDKVQIWKPEDQSLVSGPFYAHDKVRSVSYSPDGSRLAVCFGKTIQIWNVRKDVLIPPYKPEPHPIDDITSVAFSPNNSRIISISKSQGCGVWNSTDGTYHPGLLAGEPLSNSIVPVPISSDGALIAVFSTPKSRQDIQVLSTNDGSIVTGPLKHPASVTAFYFPTDHTRLVTGTAFPDRGVRLWSLQTGELAAGPFYDNESVISVALSVDGSHLVSYSGEGTYRRLRVWDLDGSTLGLDTPVDPADPSSSTLGSSSIFDGWSLRNGWIVNKESNLLFWIPPDIHSWMSEPPKLSINKFRSLSVPKQRLRIGSQWNRCYGSE